MKQLKLVLASIVLAVSAADGATSPLRIVGWPMSNSSAITDPTRRSALYNALGREEVDFVYICNGKPTDVYECSAYGFVKCATTLQSGAYGQLVLGYDSAKYELLASTDSESTGGSAYLYSNQIVSMGVYLRHHTTKETFFILALAGSNMDMTKTAYKNWLAWVKSDIAAHYPTEKMLVVFPISKSNANLRNYLSDTWGLAELHYDKTVTDFALFGSMDMFTRQSATTVSDTAVSSNAAGLLTVAHSPKCVVTFEDYDGTVLKVESADLGGSVTPPANPSRDGFTFTGWSHPQEDFQNLAAGFTAVAQYEVLGNSHVVRFVDEDGETFIAEHVVADGTAASDPETLPEHEGRHFTCWTIAGADYDMSSPVTEDMVLVARYEVNAYDVTFMDWNGDQIGDVQRVEHGSGASAPEIPDVPAGKLFWKWDNDFSEVTGSLTVTALLVDAVREIGTYEEFAAAIVDDAPAGAVYRLISDINLAVWNSVDFAGTLDGCGHVLEGLGNPLFKTVSGGRVENLTVTASTVAAGTNGGPIGFIAQTLECGAVVSNCTIASGSLLRAGTNVKGGAIAGCVQRGAEYAGERFVGIFDCTNHAAIEKTGGDYNTSSGGSGGIVGHLTVSLPSGQSSVECRIARCFNDGKITSPYAPCNIGGIAGNAKCASGSGILCFEDCFNEGTVVCSATVASSSTTATRAGGIVGVFAQSDGETRMVRCVNRGRVESGTEPEESTLDRKAAGGIAGCIDSLAAKAGFVLMDSANYGAVSGNRAGGMVAQIGANVNYAGTYVVISNVANYGAVSGVTASAQCVGKATVPNPSHVRRLVNSFFGGEASLFGDSDSADDYTASGVFTAGDEGYAARAAKNSLDAFAAASGNERWVLGCVGDAVFPELACFVTKVANTGLSVIVR